MEIDTWKKKLLKNKSKIITLNDAIIFNQWYQYFFYRLKFFVGNLSIQTVIYIIEIAFLFHILDKKTFQIIATLKITLIVANNFWWGFLEQYRDQIRDFFQEKKFAFIHPFIIKHIKLSAGVGSIVILIILILIFQFSPKILQSPYQLSLLTVISLKFLTENILQTFHSGVYALYRIRRPFLSFLYGSLIYILSILLLLPVFNQWALVIALAISTIVESYLKFFYTHKTYQLINVPENLFKKHQFIETNFPDIKMSFLSALSYSTSKIEGFVFLSFFTNKIIFNFSPDIDEFYLIYSILPLIMSSHDWAKITYFDQIKLGRSVWQNILKKYFKFSIFSGFILSFIFLIFSFITITLLKIKFQLVFLIYLFFYMLTKGIESLLKINIYNNKKYFSLIIINTLSAIVLLNIHIKNYDLNHKFSILVLINLITIVILTLIYLKLKKSQKKSYMHLFKTITKDYKSCAQIGYFELTRENTNPDSNKVAHWVNDQKWFFGLILKKIQNKLKHNGQVIHSYPGRIIWYSQDQKTLITKEFLDLITGSTYSHLYINNTSDEYDLKKIKMPNLMTIDNFKIDFRKLNENFKTIIPGGYIIDFKASFLPLELKKEMVNESLLKKCEYYFKKGEYIFDGNYLVDCLIIDNVILNIYIYKRYEKGVSKWQELILKQNLSF
jgi:hypothetical protein